MNAPTATVLWIIGYFFTLGYSAKSDDDGWDGMSVMEVVCLALLWPIALGFYTAKNQRDE